MKNNFEVTIGVEIHIELNTKTKMFSSSPNNFNAQANSAVQPLDLGYPGSLPRLNKEAVVKAIKFAKVLKMKITKLLEFDRKHYFYPDLPKGFQITQDKLPLAIDGEINIGNKTIRVERVHLEEDTAKAFHKDGNTLLNFNRAGVPLIEVVSKPDITSAKEAVAYINRIRQLALSQDVSDAKMEEGSLRADVNISVRPIGQKEYGTRVEVKNMNSLNNVKDAIESEIMSQINDLAKGIEIVQATKRFDEGKRTTVLMREKTDAIDYKYMPEPNIPSIIISKEFVDSIDNEELPEEREARYVEWGVDQEYVKQLMEDYEKSRYFDLLSYHDKNKMAKVFFGEIVPLANEKGVSVKDLNIRSDQIDIVMRELEAGNISSKHLKVIFPELVGGGARYELIIEKNNIQMISNPNKLTKFVQEAIQDNMKFVEENYERIERVQKHIIGTIMKQTNGQANPIILDKIVKEELDNV